MIKTNRKIIMKFQTILLVIAFFSVISGGAQDSNFAPNQLKAEYFQDKNVKHNLEFNDKKGNSFKILNTDSSKGLRIKKNNKWLKHGAYYTYINGKLDSKTIYNYGKKEGSYESYYSSGKIKFQCDYENDKIEGTWKCFYENGTLLKEINYKKGLKEGTRITYYPNGEKNFVTSFSNDLRHGESLQYNNKGKLESKTEYNNGEKLGKTIWY